MVVSRTLAAYKAAFHTSDDDSHDFTKFHMTLHHPEAIRRFGSVRVCDAGAGERLHKVARLYLATFFPLADSTVLLCRWR